MRGVQRLPGTLKLGLVPYGEIIETRESDPTLTFNTIGRHQSKLVRTRISSNKSPWLMNTKGGGYLHSADIPRRRPLPGGQ
jgi:phosphoribosylformylglycinamidine (FGAM) synthase-like amidotransferase family enzyme